MTVEAPPSEQITSDRRERVGWYFYDLSLIHI